MDQTHATNTPKHTTKALRKIAATPFSTGITEVLRQPIDMNLHRKIYAISESMHATIN